MLPFDTFNQCWFNNNGKPTLIQRLLSAGLASDPDLNVDPSLNQIKNQLALLFFGLHDAYRSFWFKKILVNLERYIIIHELN